MTESRPQVSHNKLVDQPHYEEETVVEQPFPEQLTPDTAADAYPKAPEKTDAGKRNILKVAIGAAAVGAAGAIFAVTAFISAKDNKETPQLPTSPGVSSEQFPGTTAASTPNTADTYGASPEQSVTERVRVNGKDYSIDEARKQLFTVSLSDAPTFEAAAAKYLAAVQAGMNMNTDRETVSDLGNSKEAAAKMNMDLLTGDDSVMLGLGTKLNKVNVTGQGKWLEPGTLAYHKSAENIEKETNSEIVSLPGTRKITGSDTAGYTLREQGFITDIEQGSKAPLVSEKYDFDIRGKINTATATWDFSDSVFVPYGK